MSGIKKYLLATFFLFGVSVNWAQKPNFLIFLVDDLGWSDLGIQGSKFYETPNIDALANSGVRFTDGYAPHPVCSPSRAALLTGKNPGRLQITQWIGGGENGTVYKRFLPLEEETFAEALKKEGYATSFFGKWHLGGSAYFPENQGFDVNKGGLDKGQPPGGYFSPYKNSKLSDGPDGEYLTDRLGSEAISWMNANKANPFLLYFSFYTVHTPIDGKPETITYYETKKTNSTNPCTTPEWQGDVRGSKFRSCDDSPKFASMVHHLDSNVGRVLKKLDSLGLTDNTVVIFTSDNGGVSYWNNTSSNLPLRGAKGWLYEGGIRVPFFVRWPGVTKAGRVVSTPVVGMDIYPTLLEMAGLPPKPAQHADGKSLVSLLRGRGASPMRTEEIIFHYPHLHGGNPGTLPGSAIRFGEYKLVEWFGGKAASDKVTVYPYSYELYKVTSDKAEKVDLASVEPEIANLLRWKLKTWRDTANANMPLDFVIPNPPTEPKIDGCTNIKASNFSLYATVNDGSCVIVPIARKSLGKSNGWIQYNSWNKELLIQSPVKGSSKLWVKNVMGKVIFQGRVNSGIKSFDLRQLTSGLYFVTIKNEKMSWVRKVSIF